MEKISSKSISYKIPVLSFFTGGGFLDMGLEQAGFDVIWSNEANPVFAGLYSYGMTKLKRANNLTAAEVKITDARSIEKIYAPEILKTAFPDEKASFFGVIGGPPCPDFSVGGKNKGGKGINGRLSKIYVHRICKIKPSFFVFENVSGLYNTKIHREFLIKLEHKLEKAGYCLDLRILNALELGLPQDRERLIMIGIKKSIVNKCLGRKIDVKKREWFRWPKRKYSDAKERFSWPEIVKASISPKKPRNVPKELTVDYCINNGNLPESTANALDTFKARSKKFHIIKEGDTKRKSFKRLHRYRYSPTVCYGHNEVHLHPWEPRRLSVREAMRIQGIPDAYELPPEATLTSKFAMVSNGVPVPLAFEVAKSLKRFFNKGNLPKKAGKNGHT